MKNVYAEAIAALEGRLDYRAVVFEVARNNPSALLKAVAALAVKERRASEPEWAKECRHLRDAVNLVAAVKRHRELFKSGLKEAVDAVKAL